MTPAEPVQYSKAEAIYCPKSNLYNVPSPSCTPKVEVQLKPNASEVVQARWLRKLPERRGKIKPFATWSILHEDLKGK